MRSLSCWSHGLQQLAVCIWMRVQSLVIYGSKGYSLWLAPPPRQRLVDYSGQCPSEGWIAQMKEHRYGNPEVTGSSPGSVKLSLPIFQIFWKFPVSLSLFVFWVFLINSVFSTAHCIKCWAFLQHFRYELSLFMVMFGVVYMGYASFCFLVFYTLRDYSSFLRTLSSLFGTLLGKELVGAPPTMTAVFDF